MLKQISGAAGCILFLLAGTAGYTQQLNGTTTDGQLLSGASAERGGLYNPNLYDGSASINIPIYNFTTETGSYGVSLGYNTKGVMVQESASPLGLHWSTLAGGSIQRSVKDLPDELDLPINNPWGYIEYTRLKGRYAASYETQSEAADTGVYRDKESDDFNVSIGSLSFTFNIGKERAIFTHPERRARVTLMSGGVPVEQLPTYPDYRTIDFRITDEAGNQYYFIYGGGESRSIESEYYKPGLENGVGGYLLINSWVISKVVLSNGTEINYRYDNRSVQGVDVFMGYFSSETSSSFQVGSPVNTSGYGEKILSGIDYPNGTKVDFLYESNPGTTRCDDPGKALREIKVSSGDQAQRYVLDQAYFVAVTGTNTSVTESAYGSPCTNINYTPLGSATAIPHSTRNTHRLKLKGIRLVSKDSAVSEPYYTFDYSTVPVPLRKGSGQDYFGYYNGKSPVYNYGASGYGYTGFESIPYHSIATYNPSLNYGFGLDKTEDVAYMKAGILTSITNANSGKVDFEYVAHSGISNVTGSLTLPTDNLFMGVDANDGLCLRSITETDAYHPGSFKKTTYTYEQGQRFMPGGYFHYNTKMDDLTSDVAVQWSFQNSFVSRHQLVNGSNHGYGKVTATVTSEIGPISKREITFTNLSDATSGNQPRYQLNGGSKQYFEFPFTDKQYLREWEMGLPLTITDYDESGRIVMKIANTYTFSAPDLTSSLTKKVENTKVAKMPYNNAPVITYWENWDSIAVFALRSFTDTYRPYTGTALLNKSITYKYTSNSAFVTDTAWYTYDSRKNPLETIARLSVGGKSVIRQVYNYDAPALAGSTLTLMTDAGIEKVVSTQRWQETGSTVSTRKLLEASITGYRFDNGKLWTERMYVQRTNSPVTYSQYTTPIANLNLQTAYAGQPIGYLEKATEVQLFDGNGNPLESWLPEQNIYKATIWDSVRGLKRAEAMNAHYNDIAYCSFDNNETDMSLFIVRGNVYYNLNQVVSSSIAGRGGYRLGQDVVYSDIKGNRNLTAGKEYMLSFWAKDGVPLVRYDGTPLSVQDAVYSNGTWSNYQIRFTAATAGTFSIGRQASGTIYVDEVRLCPAASGMESWTYEPLCGTSSETSVNGRITYYEYDPLGRAVLVRDQEGNILSRTKHVVQGPQ